MAPNRSWAEAQRQHGRIVVVQGDGAVGRRLAAGKLRWKGGRFLAPEAVIFGVIFTGHYILYVIPVDYCQVF
jgi:uncharacterized protein (DUF2126 family)